MIFIYFIFLVDEKKVIELEKRYWQIKSFSKTGKYDLELFKSFTSPPLPEMFVESKFSDCTVLCYYSLIVILILLFFLFNVPYILSSISIFLFTGFYEFFDKNKDGHIDFKEMVCGISTFCRGLTSEQLEGKLGYACYYSVKSRFIKKNLILQK